MRISEVLSAKPSQAIVTISPDAGVRELTAASMSYSSAPSWDQLGRQGEFDALLRQCWRTRAYGDFWSYMMVAEGAVDIAAEPELNVWDMAALDIIVREAGGQFTSLAGESGPWGANAVATNGRLHDAVMAYLGHFPDDGSAWADDAEGREESLGDNVTRLRFHRDD